MLDVKKKNWTSNIVFIYKKKSLTMKFHFEINWTQIIIISRSNSPLN